MLSNKTKFVIVSPRQFSGGSIVLHKLCKMLQDAGFDSKIYYCGKFSFKPEDSYLKFIKKTILFTLKDTFKLFVSKIFRKRFENHTFFKGFYYQPIRGCKRKYLPTADKNTIVIYPEIIEGNPLRAKNTIFWLLYHYDKNKIYNMNNSLVLTFREVFNNKTINPDCKTVKLTHYDLDLFQNTHSVRTHEKCYIIRKGKKRTDLPKYFDGQIIDNLSEPTIAHIFNTTKYCISYDTQTAYTNLAALCGCIPIIIPEKGKSRKDYLGTNEPGYGKAYGFSEKEINFAKSTFYMLKKKYQDNEIRNMQNFEKFLEYCEMLIKK